MVDSSESYTPYRELPIVGKYFQELDHAVGEKGLQTAMMDLIKQTHSKLEVNGLDEETRQVLAQKPALLIANHPYDAEGIPLIASLPQRNDIYIIGTSAFQGVGTNVVEHLIPVYTTDHAKASPKLSVKLGQRLNFRITPELSSEEAKAINKQVVGTAVRKLKEGALVVLFPGGIKGKEAKWFSGLGKIVNLLGSEGHVSLVKAYVEGCSNFDPLRFVPGIRHILPKLKVTFAKPQAFSEISTEQLSSRKLTNSLQQEYEAWVKSLTPRG